MITNERFSDALWSSIKIDHPIHIGGLGGIGHGLALQLGAQDHYLYLYDMDVVEPHNCIPQGYTVEQIGLAKTIATVNDLYSSYRTRAIAKTINIDYTTSLGPICFACFDNMQARKDMFKVWSSFDNRKLFVDSRLLAEYFQVFFVEKGMEERYMETLFNDEEVDNEACTYKQTRHVSSMLHSYIISLFNIWKIKEYKNIELKKIPFLTTFDARIIDWEYVY